MSHHVTKQQQQQQQNPQKTLSNFNSFPQLAKGFERFDRFSLQKKHNAGLNMRHKHGNQTITAALEGQSNTL